MATRSFAADDETAVGIGPVERLTAGAGRILRYQLNVIASTTADVVQSAGGWLCDRARAGWDVNVLVADGGDPRPLAILGATALDLDEGFLSMVRSASRVGALAVSADLLATDARVREEIVRALKRGLTEVIVWGRQWPAELGGQADPVQHRVSPAARAFKSHALVAADVSTDSVTPTETLFRIGTGSFRALRSV
ncbi:MAG: hypothetical protein QOJ20_3997 [Mycobacterium sp.]|jgi:hypothetical protein|nr:hypothetical protein [Mycobacterium sp.]MDT5282802.1 hypothetical protein [Mycobacterium sp.]